MRFMEHTRFLMAASSRTFLLGLDRSTMVFDKRGTPMGLETMHTFCFTPDEVEHLLNGTAPYPAPEHWKYRADGLVEKVQDRALYGGEGIIVEFGHGEFEVDGFEYEYWDASPLMFAFEPGIAKVHGVYRMSSTDPLTIELANIETLAS